MTSPENLPDLIAAGVQQAAEQSVRLGMSWNLRQGTVTSKDDEQVSVILDGDTDQDTRTAVKPIPLCGIPATGARVMVLLIPDAAFIVAILGGRVNSQVMDRALARCDSDLVLTLVDQDVSGATVTVFGGGEWECTGVFDFDESTTAGTTLAAGSLVVDGVTQTGDAVFELTTTNDRACVMQQWTGQFSSMGEHVFKLVAHKTVNAGNVVVQNIDTSIKVVTYH